MAWKVVGKRMLLYFIVHEQWRIKSGIYQMQRGTPISASILVRSRKIALSQEKNLLSAPLFCYPESDAISPPADDGPAGNKY
jgi:hypothetical protein